MPDKILQEYRTIKGDWIFKHKNIQYLRDIAIWIQFHLERSKGFFGFWIDFGKNIIWAAIGIKFLPDYIPELGFISEHPTKYIIIGSISMLVFFLIWSQIMDFIQYSQAQSNLANIRNSYMLEIKEGVESLKKQFKKG